MRVGGKATHEQLRRHNLHLLLRAVYTGQADNRAALAAQTGLAKPTVSELVGELLKAGLLAEGGQGQSTESGGKRPTLLRFVPSARQVIGISVDTELAAMAQHTFDTDETSSNLVTILINHSIEIGIALGGALYHRGSDIGCLRIASASGIADVLEHFLTAPAVQTRTAALAKRYPDSALSLDPMPYLSIREGGQSGNPIALTLYDELSGYIAQICAWVIALLRPDRVTLAGPIVDLGETLLVQTKDKVAAFLQSTTLDGVTFSFAAADSLTARGAVANALQKELGIL